MGESTVAVALAGIKEKAKKVKSSAAVWQAQSVTVVAAVIASSLSAQGMYEVMRLDLGLSPKFALATAVLFDLAFIASALWARVAVLEGNPNARRLEALTWFLGLSAGLYAGSRALRVALATGVGGVATDMQAVQNASLRVAAALLACMLWQMWLSRGRQLADGLATRAEARVSRRARGVALAAVDVQLRVASGEGESRAMRRAMRRLMRRRVALSRVAPVATQGTPQEIEAAWLQWAAGTAALPAMTRPRPVEFVATPDPVADVVSPGVGDASCEGSDDIHATGEVLATDSDMAAPADGVSRDLLRRHVSHRRPTCLDVSAVSRDGERVQVALSDGRSVTLLVSQTRRDKVAATLAQLGMGTAPATVARVVQATGETASTRTLQRDVRDIGEGLPTRSDVVADLALSLMPAA